MGHEIEDMWLDGKRMGEIGFAHATAASLGVPVVMLSGDDAACDEVAAWDPGVVTAPVKYAVDRFAARLRPVSEALKAIEEAATEGVRRAEGFGRLIAPQSTAALAIRWQSATVASHLEAIPGVSLRDARTVEITGAVPDLYRLFGVFMRVAAAVSDQHPYC
jgi:D-amino peptidase